MERFIEMHNKDYNNAKKELQNGKKETHWMWYIFPQIEGISNSKNGKIYSIKNIEEAKEYYNNDILKEHLLTLIEILINLEINDPFIIFGYPDYMKFQSSLTLFHIAIPNEPLFTKAINKFYNGEYDEKTLNILNHQNSFLSKKVLITSFKPFNNSSVNYSNEVMKKLNNHNNYHTVELDVLYDESYNYLKSNYNLDDYDLIVSLGEARSRKKITLEFYARNISSCRIPDNNNVLKQNNIIISGGKDILKTQLPISKVNSLIDISLDVGKYVCNNLYYHLLYNYSSKSIFIHIPTCNDNEEEYIKHANTINKIIYKLLI